MRRLSSLFWLAPLALTACTPDDPAENLAGCQDISSTALSLDETSTLGFKASDLLAAVEKTYTDTLVWSDGSTTGLTLAIDYVDGAIAFVDSEYQSADDGGEIYAPDMMMCPDRVDVAVNVTLKTDDGAFDESWSLTLSTTNGTEGSLYKELALDGLKGTYAIRELDPADFDDVTAFISAVVSAEGSRGELHEQGSKVDGETAMAENATAGSWPAVTAQ